MAERQRPPSTGREMRRAAGLINMRIRRGRLTRPARCERCGRSCRPDAHHEDYSKPDVVAWLCRSCHNRRHFEIGAGINVPQASRPAPRVRKARKAAKVIKAPWTAPQPVAPMQSVDEMFLELRQRLWQRRRSVLEADPVRGAERRNPACLPEAARVVADMGRKIKGLVEAEYGPASGGASGEAAP